MQEMARIEQIQEFFQSDKAYWGSLVSTTQRNVLQRPFHDEARQTFQGRSGLRFRQRPTE